MALKACSSVDSRPPRNVPDLSGKVILVTGGTAGIGKATINTLIQANPLRIYFTARNLEKAREVIEEMSTSHGPAINVKEILHVLHCDLTDLQTVQSAAHEVLSSPDARLDIFMGCAGVMAVPHGITKDGYEVQFGINHLSHALLIKLLLPLLLQSPDPRIVLLTSLGFGLHPEKGIHFETLHSAQENGELGIAGRWRAYGQSKLANILYAAELARRYPSITSTAVHPGVTRTDLVGTLKWFDRFQIWASNFGKYLSPEEGSRSGIWAAVTPVYKSEGHNDGKTDKRVRGKGFVVNGGFYEPVGTPGKHARMSRDEDLAKRLWVWTEEELKKFG